MSNSAKIIESSGKSVESKGYPGLFDCLLEHAVKETKASFGWTGPKLSPEMWSEVMAFFQWTQAEHRSEAQVRLFVHPEHGWLAWAFPQKGGTSMTTKEIEGEEFAKQRGERIPAGYVAFGTIHHHCTMSAFQSGTDESDEKSVDGLHITVGGMMGDKFSLHARIYIKGNKFEPNMSAFWDIGGESSGHLAFVASLGFKTDEVMDKLAREQMCVPPAKDHPFNALWKENYIVPPPYVPGSYHSSGGGSTVGHMWPDDNTSRKSRKQRKREASYQNGYEHIFGNGQHSGMVPDPKKTSVKLMTPDDILLELERMASISNFSNDDIVDAIQQVGDGVKMQLYQLISDLCGENAVALEDLFEQMMKNITEDELDKQRQQAVAEGGSPQLPANWDGYGYGLD